MSDKRLKFVVFSDLHINIWKNFPSRMDTAFKVLDVISDICEKESVPAIHCGDLFHTQESLSNELLGKVVDKFLELNNKDWRCFTISGNHGQSDRLGTYSYESTFAKLFNWLQCIDNKTVRFGNVLFHGVPYLNDNVGLKRILKGFKISKEKGDKNILLLHTDYDGARDTDGRVIGSVENLPRVGLRKFDLVLCGHIHKYQKLDRDVYMVGAPYQQRFTDEGNKMGYLKIFMDMSVEFVPIKGNPRFITVASSEDKKEGKDYYRVISKKTILEKPKAIQINKDLSKVKVVRKYLRINKINDVEKKKLLTKIIKEVDND